MGREIQQGIGDAEIDVDADTTKAKKEIRDVEKGHYKAEVKVDVDQASLAKTRRVIASAGGGGGEVGSALGNLGKGEALTLALGIGPNVVPLIGSAGQAVAQLSGVLGLIPAEASDLVTLTRTDIEYDYRGDVIDAHAPEMPTRFAKQLSQVVRGAVAIGMDRAQALRFAIRCARDSMPPLRLTIIADLAKNPDSSTSDVRRRIGKPRATVDRQLQALHILGAAVVEEYEYGPHGKTQLFYSLSDHISPQVIEPQSFPDLSVHTSNPLEESQEERTQNTEPGIGSDISDKGAATNSQCPNTGQTAYLNGQCRDGCSNQHAPGKPRCDTCHRIWLTTVDGYER